MDVMCFYGSERGKAPKRCSRVQPGASVHVCSRKSGHLVLLSFAEDPDGADEGNRTNPISQAAGFGPHHLSLDRRSCRITPGCADQLIVDAAHCHGCPRPDKHVAKNTGATGPRITFAWARQTESSDACSMAAFVRASRCRLAGSSLVRW